MILGVRIYFGHDAENLTFSLKLRFPNLTLNLLYFIYKSDFIIINWYWHPVVKVGRFLDCVCATRKPDSVRATFLDRASRCFLIVCGGANIDIMIFLLSMITLSWVHTNKTTTLKNRTFKRWLFIYYCMNSYTYYW